MPRAVSPWTWAKALRDHGPRDCEFLCAMLVLRTYMDQGGFAYPSLRTWADAARMTVNTLQKRIGVATAVGWLVVEKRAPTRHQPRTGRLFTTARAVYRCTIPDDVHIDGADEQIADAIAARTADVDESLSVSPPERVRTVREPFEAPSKGLAVAPAVSSGDTDPSNGAASVSSPDTDARTARPMQSQPVDESPSVSNATPICVKAASDLCQNQESSVSAKSRNALNLGQVAREVLKFSERSSEGAAATARTTQPQNANKREDERSRRKKARKMLEAAPSTDDARIASMYSLTLDEVRSVRAELAECT